jgi:hypothetical protein
VRRSCAITMLGGRRSGFFATGLVLALVTIALALACRPAFAAGPSPVEFETIKNVPGRDACLTLARIDRTRYRIAVYRSDGEAAVRSTLWIGSLGVGKMKITAGDFDGNTLTDLMVLIRRRDGSTDAVAFLSDGIRLVRTGTLDCPLPSATWASVKLAVADYGAGERQVALLLCPGTSTGTRVMTVRLAAQKMLRTRILRAPTVQIPVGSQLAAGDTDGDARDETVILSPTSDGTKLRVFESTGAALEPVATWSGSLAPGTKLSVGDIDGDAGDEVLALSPSGGAGSLTVLQVDGDAVTASTVAGLPAPSSCQLATGDVLGAGRSQIVAMQRSGTGTSRLVAYAYSAGAPEVQGHELWNGSLAFGSSAFDCRRSRTAILRQGVHVASPQTMTALTTLDNGTAVFKGTSAQLSDLKPNDILLLPPSDVTPDGVLARVESVTGDGTSQSVALKPATLRDIFKQVEISVEPPPLDLPQNTGPVAGARGPEAPAVAAGDSPWVPIWYIDPAKAKITDPSNSANYVSVGGQLWAYFGVLFNYSPLMGGEASYLKLRAGEKTDQLTATANCGVAFKAEKNLAKWKLKDFHFDVAGVPVWVTVNLSLDASAQLGAKAYAKAVVTESWEGEIGVQSNPWHLVFDSTPEFSGKFPPEYDAEDKLKNPKGIFEARTDLKLKLSFLLYDAVGGFGGVGPFVRAYASDQEDPWWKLYGGLAANAGLRLQMPFWGWTLWQKEWKWDLWSATLAQAATGSNPVDKLAPVTYLLNPIPAREGVDEIGWINGPEFAKLLPRLFSHRFEFFSSDRGSRKPVEKVEARSDLWIGWRSLPRALVRIYNPKTRAWQWVPSMSTFCVQLSPVEGRHGISWRAVDRASPANVESILGNRYEFGIDFHAPITSATSARELIATKITFTAHDWYPPSPATASGMAYTEYIVDDGPWTRLAGQSIYVARPGQHVVTYCSVDVAGNRETPKSISVYNPDLP